jgi:hypothetical protein
LGAGAFAKVYKIKRLYDNQMCAAKIYHIPEHFMNKLEEMGHGREVEILKEADHPFLIEYIEEFSY